MVLIYTLHNYLVNYKYKSESVIEEKEKIIKS
jgi:hypothetical protein